MRFAKYGQNLVQRLDLGLLLPRGEARPDPGTGSGKEVRPRVLYLSDGGEEDIPESLRQPAFTLSVHPEGRYDLILLPCLSKKLFDLYGKAEEASGLPALLESLILPCLAEGGVLVLGMENSAWIWNLAGAEKVPEIQYVSYPELAGMRARLGSALPGGRDCVYFPMPGLAAPRRIYPEHALPKEGEEDMEYDALLKTGDFQALAPSFLYVYQRGAGDGVHTLGGGETPASFPFLITKPIPSLEAPEEPEGRAGRVFVRREEITEENLAALERRVAENDRCLRQIGEEIRADRIILRREHREGRLTQAHISNLEKFVRQYEERIAKYRKEIAYYEKNLSSVEKAKVRHKERMDRLLPPESRKSKLLSYARDALLHPVRSLPQYLSEEGKNRIAGDLRIGTGYRVHGKLHFQRPEKPLISFIVLCQDDVSYTYRLLYCLQEYTDFARMPYEVVLADDLSTDATREIKNYVDGLILMRNRERSGFLKNARHAASAAKGKYLVFLESHLFLEKGWIEALLELPEKDPEVAMVGPMLLDTEDKLLSAGGIVWSDGCCMQYGRGGSPSDFRFLYKKEVDFLSEEAFLIRADIWHACHGLDASLSQEGTGMADLGFAVRKQGGKVLYLPSLKIRYEGAVTQPELLPTEAVPLFFAKWEEELKGQCVSKDGQKRNPFRARERGMGRTYVLILDHHVPTWDQDAGSKTTMQYIRLLLRHGYCVKLIGDIFDHPEPYTSVLQGLGVEVLYGNEMQAGIWDWLDENGEMLDIVFLNRPFTSSKYIDYLRDNTQARCIYYGHDLHYLRTQREYETSGDPKLLEDVLYWKYKELDVIRRSYVSYYPSEVEVECLKNYDPSLPVKAVLPYVYTEEAKINRNFAKRENLLFVGGFGHPPNKDGLLWFVGEILPEVRRILPEVRLLVAGSAAEKDEEIMALDKREDVEILGYVSDKRLHALYQKSRLVVVPLRFGAGVKGKVVDALHEGAVVISTSIGAEGIPGAEDVLVIRDTAHTFASEIIRLYPQTELLSKVSAASSDLVRREYSADLAWSQIREDFTI